MVLTTSEDRTTDRTHIVIVPPSPKPYLVLGLAILVFMEGLFIAVTGPESSWHWVLFVLLLPFPAWLVLYKGHQVHRRRSRYFKEVRRYDEDARVTVLTGTLPHNRRQLLRWLLCHFRVPTTRDLPPVLLVKGFALPPPEGEHRFPPHQVPCCARPWAVVFVPLFLLWTLVCWALQQADTVWVAHIRLARIAWGALFILALGELILWFWQRTGGQKELIIAPGCIHVRTADKEETFPVRNGFVCIMQATFWGRKPGYTLLTLFSTEKPCTFAVYRLPRELFLTAVRSTYRIRPEALSGPLF